MALAIERTTSIDPIEVSPVPWLVDDLALGRFGRLRLAIHLEDTFDLELADEFVERFCNGLWHRRLFQPSPFRDFEFAALPCRPSSAAKTQPAATRRSEQARLPSSTAVREWTATVAPAGCGGRSLARRRRPQPPNGRAASGAGRGGTWSILTP